jgi:hypothetical protein
MEKFDKITMPSVVCFVHALAGSNAGLAWQLAWPRHSNSGCSSGFGHRWNARLDGVQGRKGSESTEHNGRCPANLQVRSRKEDGMHGGILTMSPCVEGDQDDRGEKGDDKLASDECFTWSDSSALLWP